MENEDNKKKFDWSLKQILRFVKIVTGASLKIAQNGISQRSFASKFIAVVSGCFIFFSNLFINGPRVINKKKFAWMKEIENFDSPFVFFPRLSRCFAAVRY